MATNNWENLIASWDSVLQDAFKSAVYSLRDQGQISHIAARLEAGDVEGALQAVGLDPVAFRVFDKTIADAFESGGNVTVRGIPPIIADDGFRTIVQFNIRNPAAEAWLSDHSGTLIKEIMDDQRAMIRAYLADGMANGLNPRTVALDLVGRVGASGRREGESLG